MSFVLFWRLEFNDSIDASTFPIWVFIQNTSFELINKNALKAALFDFFLFFRVFYFSVADGEKGEGKSAFQNNGGISRVEHWNIHCTILSTSSE